MNRHHIGKIALDLHWRGQEDGISLQQQVSRLLRDSVLPALEPLFDELADEHTVIAIEYLDLDLGQIPATRWQEVLTEQLREAIQREIRRRMTSSTPEERLETIPVAQSDFKHWLYFLEHGHLPAQAGQRGESDRLRAVLETLSSQTWAVEEFRELLRRNNTALRRLLRQHDAAWLRRLSAVTARVNPEHLYLLSQQVLQLLRRLPKYPEQAPGRPSRQYSAFDKALLVLVRQTQDVFEEKFWCFFWQQLLASSQAPAPEQVVQAVFDDTIPRARLPFWYAWLEQVLHAEREAPFYPVLSPVFENIARQYPRLEIPPAPPERSAAPRKNQEDTGAGTRVKPGPGRSEQPDDSPPDPDPVTSRRANQDAVQSLKAPTPDTGPPPVVPDARDMDSSTGHAAAMEPGIAASSRTTTGSDQEKHQDVAPKGGQLPDAMLLQPGEFQYVKNAGLILLHPFLPAFFQENRLVSDYKFSSLGSRQKAVYLLHYLATGLSSAPEYELLLPKLLCAWPADEPLGRGGSVSKKAQSASMDLLRAAIRHWGRLGGSSPAALREGFLQRPGKLSRADAGTWLLQIEQSGIDILLNGLPWGISIVKLPWMPQILHVEWNYG